MRSEQPSRVEIRLSAKLYNVERALTEQLPIPVSPLDVLPSDSICVGDEQIWSSESLVDSLSLVLEEDGPVEMALFSVVHPDSVQDSPG